MEKEWQSGEGGREEMGRRKKRKKRGKERDGEERERVDFSPLVRIPAGAHEVIHFFGTVNG